MSGDMLRIARDTEVITSFLRVADSGADGDEKPPEKSTYLFQQQQLLQQQQLQQQQLQQATAHSGVWQLSKELKLKNSKANRRSRRYEECYTDKDRAAAVNMGSRDIKQSLKMKRKQERSKALHLPEETEPGALLALAGYEMTARRTNIALSFINKALNLNPEDKNALVARSKCYLLLGEAKHALEDAESALALDCTFIKGLFRKAEALYHLGNFEHSLMYFHRGLRMRPDMEGFRLGVQKAQQAIENVIGHCRTGVLASTEELVSLMKCAKNVDELYRVANVEISTLAEIKNKTPQSKESIKKRAERHLLGELYADKVYLEDLLTKKMDIINLKSDFAHSDVAEQAREGIEFLTTRQDFWRQQKPKGAVTIKKKPRQVKKKLEK